MHIPALMVVTYIVCCLRIRTAPWKYFQLNARYFSEREGIFSKLQLDALIPDEWRLPQQLDSPDHLPAGYPVFLKPEWGQNAAGIHRADDLCALLRLRRELSDRPERYLIQDAAPGAHEYEIFGIDSTRDGSAHEVLTVTEAVNTRERFPINSKNNRDTRYVELTDRFDDAERHTLSGYLSELGQFGISRLSVRATSREALLAGDFKVIEVNLYVPMPINLLDDAYDWSMRWRFIRRAMMALALSTRAIVPVERPRAIFTLMLLYGRKRRRENQRFEARRRHVLDGGGLDGMDGGSARTPHGS